jgi:hypothetical protein
MSTVATIEREQTPVAISESATILSVIQRAAADPQCDIEKMERLMAMHERMQDRSAQAEFSKAMAEMQCEIPSIAERGKGHGTIKYATLEDINDIMKPIMQKYGFAISFKVVHANTGVSVTGILMHRAGHREETTMMLPSDTSGSKNAVQAVGSSTSYGKRYVMCALLNITTRGEDDDGHAAVPTASITAAQAAGITALLAHCTEKTREWFTGEYGSVECVPKARHDILVAQLNKAIIAAETAK